MVHDLVEEVVMIGRDVGNTVVIPDTEISRQHARLTRSPAGYVVEDLGSTNGTFVNGERISAARVLNPGDLIAFGETVSMTYDALAPEAAATVAHPAAEPAAGPPPPVQKAPQAWGAQVPPAAIPTPPGVTAPPKKRWSIGIVGAGIAFLVLACLVVLVYMWNMPQSQWCIILTPLRILGFEFPGC
jgi:predicted component of type VI protein secretion system